MKILKQINLLSINSKRKKEFLESFLNNLKKEKNIKPRNLKYTSLRTTKRSEAIPSTVKSNLTARASLFDLTALPIKQGQSSEKYLTKQISIFEKIHNLFSPTKFLLKIPQNTTQTINITTLPFSHLIIEIGKNTNLTIIENLEKKDKESSSSSVEIFQEENSKVEYIYTQTEKIENHINIKTAYLKKDSHIVWLPNIIGGDQTYNKITTFLDNGNAELYGTYFSNKKEKIYIDYQSFHEKKGKSDINVYGVSKDSSYTNFYGNIHIKQKGKKADGNLKEECILLNKTAKHTAMPVLEIKTNDVQAKHVSSTTKINNNFLFYLESRGISNKEAKKQIVISFLENALKHLKNKEAKKQIYNSINSKI